MEEPTPGVDRLSRRTPDELVAEIAERLATHGTTEARRLATRKLSENLYLILITLPDDVSLRDIGLDEFITSKVLEGVYAITEPKIDPKDDNLHYRFAHFQDLFTTSVGEAMEVLGAASPVEVMDLSDVLVVAHTRLFANPETVELVEEVLPRGYSTSNLREALAALPSIEFPQT